MVSHEEASTAATRNVKCIRLWLSRGVFVAPREISSRERRGRVDLGQLGSAGERELGCLAHRNIKKPGAFWARALLSLVLRANAPGGGAAILDTVAAFLAPFLSLSEAFPMAAAAYATLL